MAASVAPSPSVVQDRSDAARMEEKEAGKCGCRPRASRGRLSALPRRWLVTGALLLAIGLLLLVCGAWPSPVGGALLLSGAPIACLALCLLGWLPIYLRCRSTPARPQSDSPDAVDAAKSDYPMGPLVVLTLPTTASPEPSDAASTGPRDGTASTPDLLGRSHKNKPPLASAETLTPSLLSSRGSVDSNL
ncbi:uncharacterized protein [Centruroides vittatus]|uniref:uncharacterized protein n=1 Tax=Centruroides vittatus TaxID=120091 RepID=UPI00350FA61E